MSSLHPESEYYLHSESHDLIYKPRGGVNTSSPFVVKCWNVNIIARTPDTFLAFLLEARDLGASHESLKRLVEVNRLTDFIHDCEMILNTKE